MTDMQLVIVDDSKDLIESIEIYATAMGWKVAASDGTTVPDIEPHLPTLVLLDYRLGNAKPEDWLLRFKATYPDLNGRIYLLSGQAPSDDLRQFELEHPIDGILTKPLVLDRLTTLLGDRAPLPRPKRTTMGDPLLIEVANRLPAAVRVLDAATLEPLYENPSAANYPLDDAARKTVQMMAHRLEQARAPRHTHMECDNDRWSLYTIVLASDWYLLTKEMMPTKPDQFFTASKFAARLGRLAEHLELSYGITRLRFYRLARLYSDERVLLQPDWQRGGGFHPDETAWKHNEVLDTDVQGDLLADRWLISQVSPGTIGPEWKIGWGDATHRATVPVRKDGHPIGLLALDRRRDHLPPDQEHIARDDPTPRGVDDDDMKRMSGWLELCQSMLLDHADEHLKDRLSQWHEELSNIIQEGIEETEARPALTHVLKRIQESWEQGGEHIRDLYLLRVHDDGLLEAWAGTGPIWDVRKSQLFEAEEPYTHALKRTAVVHEFRAWYQCRSPDYRTRAEKVFGTPAAPDSPPGALKDLGSCLGVPLKQGERTFAMLAICVKRAHYFTEARVKVLEETAVRLLPMFLWGLAQAQRDWLRRALAHEYHEPVNRLHQLIEGLPTDPERKQARALLRYQSAIIKNLSLLGEEGVSCNATPSIVDLSSVVHAIMEVLQALYPDIHFEGLPELGDLAVYTSEEGLYQVLFNLFDNACKFRHDDTAVQLAARREADMLVMQIRNRVSRPIPDRDLERIWHPYERGSDPTNAKGAGVGLAVVRRLCRSLQIHCELSQRGPSEEPEVCFTLNILLGPHGNQK